MRDENPYKGIAEAIDNGPSTWQNSLGASVLTMESLKLALEMDQNRPYQPPIMMVHPAHGAWIERTGKEWHEWYHLGRIERLREVKRYYASVGAKWWKPEAYMWDGPLKPLP